MAIILKQAIYNANQTECLQIGYFLNSKSEIQVQHMPITIKKVPSVLPKEITSLKEAFQANLNEFIEGIQHWDTSNVTNMSFMFNGAQNFNQDISNWNTSKVKYMNFMFSGCRCFNQNISKWNFSKVINISYMLEATYSFKKNLSKCNFNKLLAWENWVKNSLIAHKNQYWPKRIREPF
ncbi:BspA family leucine-rich repeat surface protein [Mycoplasma leachii]|uniref:BspA family leucine-rich repeat surface protein n=1 Tax=Mycoplasma leachii TaxID=2105 RepID=UPI003DA4A602